MPARTPEQIPKLLAAAMNAGDLDAFVDLHEPDATTVVPPEGTTVTGRDEIRAALEPIFAGRPKIENEVVGKLENGGLALVHAQWQLETHDAEGQAIAFGGRGTIVSRRQTDGRWLIALENTLTPQ